MIQFLLCIFCFHIPLNQKPFGYWLKKFIYSWQRGPHSVFCPVLLKVIHIGMMLVYIVKYVSLITLSTLL